MTLFVIARSRKISIGKKITSNWIDAHATFYGDMSGRGTMRKYIYIYIYFLLNKDNYIVITRGGRNLAITLIF